MILIVEVSKTGELVKREIIDSSGDDLRDKEALSAIDATTFAPLPQWYRGQTIPFKIELAHTPTVEEEVARLESVFLPKANQGPPKDQADSLFQLGTECFELGASDKAAKYMQQALELEKGLHRSNRLVETYISMGSMFEENKPAEAVKYYEQGLLVAEDAKLTEQILLIMDSVGVLHLQMNNFVEAKQWYEKELAESIKSGRPSFHLEALINLASLARRQGDNKRSLELVQEALQFAEKVPNEKTLGSALVKLSAMQQVLGRAPQALITGRKAIEACYKASDHAAAVRGCLQLADGYFKAHDFDGAKYYYVKGINLCNSVDAPKTKASLFIGLATTELASKSFADAERDYTAALTAARAARNDELEARATHGLEAVKLQRKP